MSFSYTPSARQMTKLKGREKPQLSCDFCRRRKLRCDRKQPCDSCIRLDRAGSCVFPYPQLLNAEQKERKDKSVQDALQERIVHLESMVQSLASKQTDRSSSFPSTPAAESQINQQHTDVLTKDFGRINLRNHESSYVESSHWTAILDEISELKDSILDMDSQRLTENYETTPKAPGVDLFLASVPQVSKMDIIAAIPPRIVVDTIIAKYFQTADMPVSLCIHRHVFFKQYEKFWEDPLSMPVMWMSILFGMMFTVAYFTIYASESPSPLDEETLFEYRNIIMTARIKMIQCLRAGNYMKGTPHTIEALLFFLQVEYAQGEDTQLGCWQLLGITVRVALKMGYHRDGSHFLEMSVFEAEMRRRIWYILGQFDVGSSSHIGLPRMIREAQCDTAEPRSLLDDDFDDTTAELPPARPPNQHTLAQFLVYKSRITTVYGLICDFMTSSRQRNYTEAMYLDKLLNDAYAQKPPILEWRSMQQSILDKPDLITRRFYLTMSFYMSQMTLHRKFMISAKTDSKYTYSHATCTQAALTALSLQAELFEQCQIGRMLHANRWKLLFLVQSEFLLATTILCYNLNDDITNVRKGETPLASRDLHNRTIAALQSSRAIWQQQQAVSKEALKANRVIDIILNRAQATGNNQQVDIASSIASESLPALDSSSWTSPTSASTFSMSVDPQQPISPMAYVGAATYYNTASDGPTFQNSQDGLDLNAQLTEHVNFSNGTWAELFDMDNSWETWLEI